METHDIFSKFINKYEEILRGVDSVSVLYLDEYFRFAPLEDDSAVWLNVLLSLVVSQISLLILRGTFSNLFGLVSDADSIVITDVQVNIIVTRINDDWSDVKRDLGTILGLSL